MKSRRFEWDDAKARANLAKHGISFEDACRVFDDPHALESVTWEDGEERSLTFGRARAHLLLVVVSTDRDGRIRLISARRATKHERRMYEED